MTETVETPAEKVEEKKGPAIAEKDLPPLAQQLIAITRPQVDEIKAIVEQLSAGDNVGKLLFEAIEKSDNAEVQKITAEIKKMDDRILALKKRQEEIVKPTLELPSPEKLEALENERKEKAASVTAFATAFDAELTRNKVAEKVSLFEYIGDIPGKRRGAKPGEGKGISRPRLESVEYSWDSKGEEGFTRVGDADKSTFTHLMQVLKKETGADLSAGELQKEWYAQNNVKDWTELPTTSKFVYSVPTENGKSSKNVWIRATRRTA